MLHAYIKHAGYQSTGPCPRTGGVLAENPSCGDIIQGGGGIRKVRFSAKGKGKSGGVRVIYYWRSAAHQIYFLVIYPKNKKDTLTDKETAILRALVKELGHG